MMQPYIQRDYVWEPKQVRGLLRVKLVNERPSDRDAALIIHALDDTWFIARHTPSREWRMYRAGPSGVYILAAKTLRNMRLIAPLLIGVELW